jgi:hypothetical protein
VNCPPVRAKLGSIQTNAIRTRGAHTHLTAYQLQLVGDRARRRSSADHPTVTSIWRKIRWNVAGRDRVLAYQIAANSVKLNPKYCIHDDRCGAAQRSELFDKRTLCACQVGEQDNGRTSDSAAVSVLASRKVGRDELVTGTAFIEQTL